MMEETDIQRRIKSIRIKIRKVEEKIKYNNQDLLIIFSESKFEDRVKTITVAYEDCLDDVVGLVVDLEEENELKHKHRIDDLNRKLDNLRNTVSVHEKESIARRTEQNNDTMDPEPVSQAFSEDDQEDTINTTARQSVSSQVPAPSPQKETLKDDKNSAMSHISSPSQQPHIQDSPTIHTPNQQMPMELLTERLTCQDTNNVVFDPECMNKDDKFDSHDDGHNIYDEGDTDIDQNCETSSLIVAKPPAPVYVARKADQPQISSETYHSAQPENKEKECSIINQDTECITVQGDDYLTVVEEGQDTSCADSTKHIVTYSAPGETVSPCIVIEDKEKECLITDHSFEEEKDQVTMEEDEKMEQNVNMNATISQESSDCHKTLEHPNMAVDIELSEKPHPENKEWITVEGDAYLEFVEFGGRYKFYKCLSRTCAQSKKESKTLVVTKGVNRNSFNLHCKQKHNLKIISIRGRTGQIISIKKPRCSKCGKDFSRKQTCEDHKCKKDSKKGSIRRKRTQPLLDEQEHSSSLDHTQNASHSEETRTSNQKGRKLKRKKGISKDRKTVPKKTCRTDTADVPEVNTHPKNIIITSSHPSSYLATRASDECSEAGMQSFTNGVDNLSMLNTTQASQAADLEEVPSSSPHILQGCQRRQTHPDEDVSSPKTSESQTSKNSLAGYQKECMGEANKVNIQKRKRGISKDKQTVPKKVLNTNTAEVNTNPEEIIRTSPPPDSFPVPSRPDSECSDNGIESNTNRFENDSDDRAMLNTPQQSQAVLEDVPSSSPHILQDCQRRQTHPGEDVSSSKTTDSQPMDLRQQLLYQDKSVGDPMHSSVEIAGPSTHPSMPHTQQTTSDQPPHYVPDPAIQPPHYVPAAAIPHQLMDTEATLTNRPVGPAVIHLTANTREIQDTFISTCLGEYRVYSNSDSSDSLGVHSNSVYKQVCSVEDTYLYRTNSAWYCSYSIIQEDGVYSKMRNSNTADQVPGDSWEVNKDCYSQSPTWVPVPSLSMSTGALPQCGVITVHGGGVADGEYEVVPDQYEFGRHVCRQAVQPYCTLRVWYDGWCVKNGDTVVMRSEYASMCPADPLCGYGGGVGGCKWKCYKRRIGVISGIRDADSDSDRDDDIDDDDDDDDDDCSDDDDMVKTVNVQCSVHRF